MLQIHGLIIANKAVFTVATPPLAGEGLLAGCGGSNK